MLLLLTLIATGAAAQARGDGRIAGKVVDNDSGQPLENVQVKGTLAGQTQPVTAKSNKKGEFNLNGIGSGEWTLEFTKDGFDPQGGKLTVEEGKSPDITVKLVKHVDKPDPGVELNAKAQEGMTLMQAQKYAEARKVFEDLLAKYPDVHQVNAYIAQTYAGENNMPKAIEYMKTASDKDPENAEMRLVLADLMMEGGDKAAALDMMKTIDVTKIKNPLPLINGSISLINGNKPDEALELLNKVATQFPTQAETFYYRGRAYVAAKKYPEAKADLEKFVSMAAPDARELPDAKKLLDQLKDAK
jgi:predicted Zn-dependent protease